MKRQGEIEIDNFYAAYFFKLLYESIMNKIKFELFCIVVTFSCSVSLAATPDRSQEVNDQNMKVSFEAHAPWNILDGTAIQLSGDVTVVGGDTTDKLRANVSAQDVDYKAGLSVAGQLVATWLRSNPPTPAKFIITKSSISCAPDTITNQNVCRGTVDGTLTIWGKDYKIDFPVETQPKEHSVIVTGGKEIRWGEYGFGDPSSTIASIKPVIDMTFSMELFRQ